MANTRKSIDARRKQYSLMLYLDAYQAGCIVTGLICGLLQGKDGEGDFTVRGKQYTADADAETGTILITPATRGLNLDIERLLQQMEDGEL